MDGRTTKISLLIATLTSCALTETVYAVVRWVIGLVLKYVDWDIAAAMIPAIREIKIFKFGV